MSRLFALVDCNNFYASCERLFRPDLKHEPIVVLSNNDGCVIARSQEVKDLGIKMGAPLYQIQGEIKKHHIHVFSSNFTLYGDISSRVMQTLEEISPRVEVYSIDEAFLDTSGIRNLLDFGQSVRLTLMKHVGVPVCVGIGPTKTLAKLANYAAKKYQRTQGVVDLTDPERQKRLMERTPVDEIWGVGRQLTKSLHEIGVDTALKLAQKDPKWARQRHSVVLERTVRELNGETCLELDDVAQPRQQILYSRSFGEKLTRRDDVKQAVSEFAARAAAKLRGDNQLARVVNVFMRTSYFDKSRPRYSNAATGPLPHPTSDTRQILTLAMQLFDSIWREGYHYAKAGIMLGDFCAPDEVQLDLFSNPSTDQHSDQLMRAIDAINKHGQGKVWFGGQRAKNDWFMRRANVSPAYTTRWCCIPKVK